MRNVGRERGARLTAGLIAIGAAAIMAGVGASALGQGGGAAPPQNPPVPAPGRGGAAGLGAGPIDMPLVDRASADRGRTVYAAQCITCHGTQARGTETGANLVRSEVVLKDRYGSLLGPFLKKGHTLQSGAPASSLTDAQIGDLMHFLRDRVNDGLRSSPLFQAQNILTGDAKAGAAYFTGDGKCTQCHSPTGDFAGIGTRLTPVNIQQRFMFPMTGRGRGPAPAGGAGAAVSRTATTVTVTPASGPAISGVLVQMDDFSVTLRDSAGILRTVKRVPGMKVVKTNPFQFHIDLLDRITDKQMHDVVAYLETVK